MGSVSDVDRDNKRSLDGRAVPPLGLTGKQFLEAGNEVLAQVERYYDNIQTRSVLPSVEPGYLRKLLPESAPQRGETWSEIQQDIERTIMPGITHWQHPQYMAFFPANSTYPSMLGEIWSAALTAPAFNWICSPAVTELETIVLDWLAKILSLPASFSSKGAGGGVIQGSASEAALTVMIAARERAVRRQIDSEGLTDPDEIEDRSCEIRSRLVAVASEQAHSSIKKGAIISGTRFRAIVPQSASLSLNGEDLRPVLKKLTSQGLKPFFLSVTIGTTNTCAIDDIVSLAEVVKDYPDIWIHCDAAYAGAALVLPEFHHLSEQLALVDSFNMNMHKWLLVNFDTSPLFVKKRKDLIDALSISPAYLKNNYSETGLVVDYRDWQIPLGRRFRALKVWFVLRTYGIEGLQAHIRHHLKLGDLFAQLIRSRSDLFTILTTPAFALTVISVVPTLRAGKVSNDHSLERHMSVDHNGETSISLSPEEQEKANANTKLVYDMINDKKEFFLTSSVIGSRTAIRIVSANPLAEEKYIRGVFRALVEAAEIVLGAKH